MKPSLDVVIKNPSFDLSATILHKDKLDLLVGHDGILSQKAAQDGSH